MSECVYCGKDHNPNESKCRKIDMRERNFHLNKKLEDSLIREKSLESENKRLEKENAQLEAKIKNELKCFDQLQEKADNLRADKMELEKENAELRGLLDEILCVPQMADEASRPANFDPDIAEHRHSLVVNLSVSYDRLYRIQKKLEEQGK